VTLKASETRLRSCVSCVLGLETGWEPWHWTVEEDRGGTLTRDDTGQTRYIAPFVNELRTFHVRAVALGDGRILGRLALEVYPNALMATLDPPGKWEGAEPELRIVAGSPTGINVWREAARFSRPHGVTFLGETGQALVSYPGNRVFCMEPGEGMIGFQDLCEAGEAPEGRAPCLACPTFLSTPERPGSERRCVFTETDQDRIRLVDARGVVTRLAGAGGEHKLPPAEKHRDGAVAQARFWAPEGVAMDAAGTVYVADVGNGAVRRIQTGEVTTLQAQAHAPARCRWGCHGEGRDWPWPGALNGGLALDEGAGVLYVGVGHGIVRVPLQGDGEPGVLLGDPRTPGFEAWSSDPPAAMAGVPCLSRPNHLTCHRGRLFIADHGNHAIRVFDPGTGRLRTLAGDPSQPVTRSGPLRAGSPHLPPERCAALAYPMGIALDAAGECLVATRDGVVALRGLAGLEP
jgi:hypothetical protein